MGGAYDSELKRDFEKLVVDLGRNVMDNSITPLVRKEFKDLRENQEQFIKSSHSEITRFSQTLNKNLESLLLDNSNHIEVYSEIIQELDTLNKDIVKNLNRYLNDSNVIAMTDKLIVYGDGFEKSIQQLKLSYEEISQKNQSYLNGVNSTIKSFVNKIPDVNLFNKEINQNISNINKDLNKLSETMGKQNKIFIDENFKTIEKFKLEISSKINSVSIDLGNSIKDNKNSEKNILETQKNLTKTIINEVGNFKIQVLADIKQLMYLENSNFENVQQSLKFIEERNKELLDENGKKLDKKLYLLFGINIIIGLIILYLLLKK